MTEVSGAFGVHQVSRLEAFVSKRRANHASWCQQVHSLGLPLKVFPEQPGSHHAGFGFPMLLDESAPISRSELCRQLESHSIQTRPISGSNLARQPAFETLSSVRVEGELPVANSVHERGIFVGQSHAFGPEHGAYLASTLQTIFDSK